MRYLIESELDTAEILTALNEESKKLRSWKPIPNQNGLFISELNFQEKSKIKANSLKSMSKKRFALSDLEFLFLIKKQSIQLTITSDSILLIGPRVKVNVIGKPGTATILSGKMNSMILISASTERSVQVKNESPHPILLVYSGK